MKPFKKIDEQIDILESRGLHFENESAARKLLMQYGYYEIVNGYNKFLLENEEQFKKNEKFEHLFSIYRLDHDLQNAVLQSTLEVECLLKTALSYFIAKEYGHDERTYLKRTNYKSGNRIHSANKKNQEGHDVFEIDLSLRKFKKIIHDNIEPFRHYREDHGHVPPWILFKGCTFGNIRHFYNLQRTEIKKSVIRTMMGFPESDIYSIPDHVVQLFSDTIFVSQKFRNRAAHGGRIVGYKAMSQNIQFNDYLEETLGITKEDFREGYGNGDYFSLFAYLRLLDNRRPLLLLIVNTEYILEEHLKLYPEDRSLILSSLGVPVQWHDKSVKEIFTHFIN